VSDYVRLGHDSASPIYECQCLTGGLLSQVYKWEKESPRRGSKLGSKKSGVARSRDDRATPGSARRRIPTECKMKHTESRASDSKGTRKTARVFREGAFSETTKAARESFLKYRAGKSKSEGDCAPRTPLQKRMQSGGA
jgi:hypothetical protein